MTNCCAKMNQDSGEGVKDLTEEMRDLMNVYENAYEDASTQTEHTLHTMVYYMKNFIEAYDARYQMKEKLDCLKTKLGLNECDECEEGVG